MIGERCGVDPLLRIRTNRISVSGTKDELASIKINLEFCTCHVVQVDTTMIPEDSKLEDL